MSVCGVATRAQVRVVLNEAIFCLTFFHFSDFQKLEVAIASSELRERRGNTVQYGAFIRLVQFRHSRQLVQPVIVISIFGETEKTETKLNKTRPRVGHD